MARLWRQGLLMGVVGSALVACSAGGTVSTGAAMPTGAPVPTSTAMPTSTAVPTSGANFPNSGISREPLPAERVELPARKGFAVETTDPASREGSSAEKSSPSPGGVAAGPASAVPYDDLERLRQLSVVTRVVVDHPRSALAKKCGVKNRSRLGPALQLAMDNAEAAWSKEPLPEAEIPRLKSRLEACAKRGSCQVYSTYLGAVLGEEHPLRSEVEDILGQLDAEDYVKALPTVKDPCARLRELR